MSDIAGRAFGVVSSVSRGGVSTFDLRQALREVDALRPRDVADEVALRTATHELLRIINRVAVGGHA